MDDFLKSFMNFLQNGTGAQDWVSVAQLKPEDMLWYKTFRQEQRKRKDEMDQLIMKLRSLDAEGDLKKCEFWNKVYKSYELPSDQSYDINETGLVRKLVRNPK